MKNKLLISFFSTLLFITAIYSQKNAIYENLPTGKYAVGFKIVTITDDSRVISPEYNYLGEKNEGDPHRKITLHIWYPAKPNTGKRTLTYEEYGYNHLLTSTDEVITSEIKNRELRNRRASVEGWFGKTTDNDWKKLIEQPMLAQFGATPVGEKFPLLIGMLRPLSTSVTNELLASNGYVIAMVAQRDAGLIAETNLTALNDLRDMQLAISHLVRNENIDANKIGTFGFSGSGFMQVLLAMNDYRIKALADIESGLYMEGLFQALSSSDYYIPSKLRAPFLHIFSRDLSKQEKYIAEFENKTKFAKRYRLIINQPGLHHWDFAAEGYTSCIFLQNRGTEQNNIKKSFEIASTYLLHFFNTELKSDVQAQAFLSHKPALAQTPASLWDITILNPLKPAPNIAELEYIIKVKGIQQAMEIANATIQQDSSTNLSQGFLVNNLGYKFLNDHKYTEAIEIFKFNALLHSDDANLMDSLAEAYEAVGDTENKKKIAQQVLDLLDKKANLTDGEKALKEQNEKRSKLP